MNTCGKGDPLPGDSKEADDGAAAVFLASQQTCELCEQGFPVKHGKHIPSQAYGMIPVLPCKKERFHFRGFVVRPTGASDGLSGLVEVEIEGSDLVITAPVHELWLVNDYEQLVEI